MAYFTPPLQQMVNSTWIPKITKFLLFSEILNLATSNAIYDVFYLHHPTQASPKLHQQRDSQKDWESRNHWKEENNPTAIEKPEKGIIFKLHVICKDYIEHIFTYLYTFVYRGSLNVGELKIFHWML